VCQEAPVHTDPSGQATDRETSLKRGRVEPSVKLALSWSSSRLMVYNSSGGDLVLRARSWLDGPGVRRREETVDTLPRAKTKYRLWVQSPSAFVTSSLHFQHARSHHQPSCHHIVSSLIRRYLTTLEPPTTTADPLTACLILTPHRRHSIPSDAPSRQSALRLLIPFITRSASATTFDLRQFLGEFHATGCLQALAL
jgi:hypothetical protein